jgi:hypothetical protein
MPSGTPYITSSILLNQPAGLSWTIVPTLTADAVQQTAQLDYVCQQVTSLVDGYLQQPLRATIVTEQNQGPGMPRVSVDPHTGIAGLVTRQSPVTAINAIQVSEARCFPPNWTLIPPSQARIRTLVLQPASGVPVYGCSGGNAIDIAPGYIDRRHGRGHWLVADSYTSGWAHTSLTAAANAGENTLEVDDVTGWAGWTGFLLDAQATEVSSVVDVSATTPVMLPGLGCTVQAGPGTVTLSSGLENNHAAGAVFTAVPLGALQAAALTAAVIALETIAAIAVQSTSGMLPGGLDALAAESKSELNPFCRVM